MLDFEQRARDAFEQITRGNTNNYLNWPIPSELDAKVRDLVELYLSASTEERRIMLSSSTDRDSGVLLTFSERMAALGVRENSRQRLLEGLIALILENYTRDWRDTINCMAPLYHAAGRIGVDAQELFAEAASYADNEVAENILGFPKRRPQDRTLEAFDYKEVFEPDGFRYRQFYRTL